MYYDLPLKLNRNRYSKLTEIRMPLNRFMQYNKNEEH